MMATQVDSSRSSSSSSYNNNYTDGTNDNNAMSSSIDNKATFVSAAAFHNGIIAANQ